MISYDIHEDRRRRKIQKALEGYGERMQFSVFECDITKYQLHDLRETIAGIIDKDCDSVRYYRLCSACSRKIEFVGDGRFMEDEGFFMV